MLTSLSNSVGRQSRISQIAMRGFSTIMDNKISKSDNASKCPDKVQQVFITKFWEIIKAITPEKKAFKLSVDLQKNKNDGCGSFFWLTGTMGAGKSSLVLDFLSSLGRPIYSDDGKLISNKGFSHLKTQVNDTQIEGSRSISPKVLEFFHSLECMPYSKAVLRMDEKYNYSNKVLVYNFRDVGEIIRSRNKKWTYTDAVFHNEYKFQQFGSTVRSVIIEEAQFLTPKQVEMLKTFADKGNFVLCCGLIDDFKRNLFPGSSAIDQLYTAKVRLYNLCENCHSNFAEINARFNSEGRIMRTGPQIDIGQSQYRAICYDCWQNTNLMIKQNDDFGEK